MNTGKLIKAHFGCDKCGSSDGASLYQNPDGKYNTFCFVCNKPTWPNEKELEEVMAKPSVTKTRNNDTVNDHVHVLSHGGVGPIKERKLSKETVEKFGVTLKAKDNKIVRHIYPYYSIDGKHVANKIRHVDYKTFEVEGDWRKGTLFGQAVFPKGCNRILTVCEGELDAMSVYELSGSKSPAVSVRNGASAALKDLSDPEIYDYINSFETIVIAFDADKPGQEAARKFAEAFSPGKCKLLEYPEGIKDASDYLVAGKYAEFTKAWWNAKPYAPENIKTFDMLRDSVLNPPDIKTFPYPWEPLNEITGGQQLHQFIIIQADTGVGKTQFVKELEFFDGMTNEQKIGIIHLEEPDHRTAQGLVSIYLNTPLHLNLREVPKEDISNAFDAISNTDRYYLYDSFGSEDVDAVVSKIRYMVVVLGCTIIVLDHIHMVASDAGESERFKLDELAGKLKKLTMEAPFILLGVVHTNDDGQTRGTRVIDKLADLVIHLDRNKEEENPKLRNKTKVTVRKNRYSGETGVVCYLDYIKVTGRMLLGVSPEEEMELQ